MGKCDRVYDVGESAIAFIGVDGSAIAFVVLGVAIAFVMLGKCDRVYWVDAGVRSHAERPGRNP